MKKVFIGTVGYHNLRNHSIGPAILPQLQEMHWPPGVDIEELNWGPIAIVQKFQSHPVIYDRVILISAIERVGRKQGEITLFQWHGGLPDTDLIQRCIGDAVTGVISVENLLIIGEYFKIWTGEIILVDIEPGPEEAGETFTPEVQRMIPELIMVLQNLAGTDSLELTNFKELYGDTLIESDV